LRVAPSWFELLAWVALGLGFASALVIVADIVVLGNWQHMAIMDIAFPLTALYMGPIALWAYFARGRRMSRKRMHMHMAGVEESARDSLWQVSLSDSHCGAGCVLGDVAARVGRLGHRLGDRVDRSARPRIHPRPAARLDLRDPLPVLRDRAAAGPGRPTSAAGGRDQVGHALGA
jgi:hypothetical protein